MLGLFGVIFPQSQLSRLVSGCGHYGAVSLLNRKLFLGDVAFIMEKCFKFRGSPEGTINISIFSFNVFLQAMTSKNMNRMLRIYCPLLTLYVYQSTM